MCTQATRKLFLGQELQRADRGALWKALALTLPLLAAMSFWSASGQELANVPVYDPVSRSYFELVDAIKDKMIKYGPGSNEGPNWEEAYRFAQQRSYKGVRGRLAVVTSFETHAFLLRTFHPGTETWIGLRYWCKQRELQWSDGTMFRPGSFQAWAKNWRQDIYACASGGSIKNEYMPVAYSRVPNFQWIGKGIHKRYYDFFIQYPTGRP